MAVLRQRRLRLLGFRRPVGHPYKLAILRQRRLLVLGERRPERHIRLAVLRERSLLLLGHRHPGRDGRALGRWSRRLRSVWRQWMGKQRVGQLCVYRGLDDGTVDVVVEQVQRRQRHRRAGRRVPRRDLVGLDERCVGDKRAVD